MTDENKTELTAEQIIGAFANLAAQEIKKGKNETEVKNILIQNGAPDNIADLIIERLFSVRRSAVRKSGFSLIFWGLLMAVGGLLITLFSYAEASSRRGGGKYYIFYGLIITGALTLLKGLYRAFFSPNVADED